MLRTQLQPDLGPHVVVVGNYKGGSGKSTFAMHLIVALLNARKRVASFDLDTQQQTLSRYIENRREWARQNGVRLAMPKHTSLVDSDDDDYVRVFMRHLPKLQHKHDFIVIDTPGSESHLSLVAHGLADTLVTPINDSFVDLDVIVTIGATADSRPTPSRYARAVAAALEGRRAICGRDTDWIVFRNRLATLASRNHKQITGALELIAREVGFRIGPSLAERVIFREFFPVGLTAFDQLDGVAASASPSMSNLTARIEVRELIEAIGLLPPDAIAREPRKRSKVAMPVS
jgi:chromosome partitioning protein